jgi:hypothetical protein
VCRVFILKVTEPRPLTGLNRRAPKARPPGGFPTRNPPVSPSCFISNLDLHYFPVTLFVFCQVVGIARSYTRRGRSALLPRHALCLCQCWRYNLMLSLSHDTTWSSTAAECYAQTLGMLLRCAGLHTHLLYIRRLQRSFISTTCMFTF